MVQSLCNLLFLKAVSYTVDLSACRLVRRGYTRPTLGCQEESQVWKQAHSSKGVPRGTITLTDRLVQRVKHLCARLSAHTHNFPKHQIQTQSKKEHHRLCSSTTTAVAVVGSMQDAGLAPAAPQPRGDGGRARPPAQTRV